MKVLILAGLACASIGFAQTPNYNHRPDRMLFTKPETGKAAMGSPYFEEVYRPVRFANGSVKELRYNAYTDALEYKSGTETALLLPAKDTLISTADGKRTYVFTDYTIDNLPKEGYLLHLGKFNNVTLYAKESVKLTPESKPSNGYSDYRPATYTKLPTQYLVKRDDNLTLPISAKKKDLLKLFPGKEVQISDYLKKNKVKETDEQQMIELCKFLGSL